MGKFHQLSSELWPLIDVIFCSFIELIFRGEVSCLPAALLLAHLSRRLIGVLIGYSWSVRRRRPSLFFTMLKDLLLRNCWANHSQILCGASLGRGNESLFPASGSHDQDGPHAYIW